MLNLLKDNAFHILGLDSAATQKEIIKRSKEIIKRLKIGDSPKYDLDLDIFSDFRSEPSINDALHRLSFPQKRIVEFFFWFQIIDNVDRQAIGLLRLKDFSEAIHIWEYNSEKETETTFFYKKNLAVLFCLLLFKDKKVEYLNKSLKLWKELIDSDIFWEHFFELYKNNDVVHTSKEVFDDFRSNVISRISDIYTQIGRFHNDDSYLYRFNEVFSTKGDVLKKTVLAPINESLNTAIETLERMNVSQDGILDKDESELIKKSISNIQEQLNRLIDIGLYDESQSKAMRDRAANAIRTVVMDLHNKLGEVDKSMALLDVALNICGTSGQLNKIKNDIKTINKIKQNAQAVEKATKLIEQQEFEEALKQIEHDEEKYKNNPDVLEITISQKKYCISILSLQKHKNAFDSFKAGNFDQAKLLFDQISKMIYDNLDLFKFNKAYIDDLISIIRNNCAVAKRSDLEQIDIFKQDIIERAKEAFEGQFEESILLVLFDCYTYSGLTGLFKRIQRKNFIINALSIIGWLTIWVYGLGLLFWGASWIYGNIED